MNNEELKGVVGGIALSSPLINALTKAVTTVYDLSRRLGSTVYRLTHNATCGA